MTIISIFDKTEQSGTAYITIGDEFSGKNAAEEFALSKNEWKKLIGSQNITPGLPVTEDVYREIAAASERTRAVRLGGAIASRSDKSASAVRKKLCEAGISKDVATYAVELLIRRGYIDEVSQCERIAESLVKYKRYGRGRIVQYLIAHGYPAETSKMAAAALDDDDVSSALAITIEKKFPDIGEYSPADTKKAVASLVRLGFTPSEVFSEIRRIKNND